MSFPTPQWDLTLFELINSEWRNDFLDFVMPILSSYYMILVFVLPIVLVAVFSPANRKKFFTALLLIGVVVGLTEPTVNLIKDTVGRPRPYKVEPGAHYYNKNASEWVQRAENLVPDNRGNSFVSAHAANAMAIAVILTLIWPKLRSVTWTFPLLVGYSRIYLAKHYPLDVLGGWLVGFVIAFLLWKLILHRFVPLSDDNGVIRIARVYS